jgi:hypothetical protein
MIRRRLIAPITAVATLVTGSVLGVRLTAATASRRLPTASASPLTSKILNPRFDEAYVATVPGTSSPTFAPHG